MANQNAFVTTIAMLSAAISGLSYLLAFIYALVQSTRHRQPAAWLLAALSLWIVAFILLMVLNPVLSGYVSPNDMAQYFMLANLVQSCLHALGLVCMMVAVFSDRTATRREEFLANDQVELRPSSDNPFSSPRA